MKQVLLIRCLLCVMSFLIIVSALFLVLDIWQYESHLAYKLGLTAMVLGMACAGVFAFYLAMAL